LKTMEDEDKLLSLSKQILQSPLSIEQARKL
jgi:hypothetical protein